MVTTARIPRCTHCFALMTGQVVENEPLFCCTGCEAAHHFISACNLSGYYKLKQSDAHHPPAMLPGGAYAELTDPALIDQARQTDGTYRFSFYVEGVHCAACLWVLEKLPELVEGIATARLTMSTNILTVTTVSIPSLSDIAVTIAKLGYRPRYLRPGDSSDQLQVRENRRELIRVGVAFALNSNIMLMTVPIYGGAVSNWHIGFTTISGGLCLIVVTYCAWPFYKSAWGALRHRQINLDTPIAIAILVGFALSLWSAAIHSGETYFDSIAMLTALLLGSRHLLRIIQQKTGQSLDRIWAGLPESAQVESADGTPVSMRADQVQIGSIIHVLPSGIVPIDGIVIEGFSHINSAMLTGESSPQRIKPGAAVFAGTQNLTNRLRIQTIQRQGESRVAQLLSQLKSLPKPTWIRRTDRIAQRLLLIVMGLSLALIAWGIITGHPNDGIHRALALLIVTCPCALGIAAPLTLSVSVSRGAQANILIKNPDILEKLPACSPVFLDKTGTITHGQSDVCDIVTLPGMPPEAPAIAVALERHTRHPIGQAIRRFYASPALPTLTLDHHTEKLGVGVFGGYMGREWSIQKSATPPKATGTWVTLYENTTPWIQFEIADTLRPDAASCIRAINPDQVQLLSGDRQVVVTEIGRQLGLSVDHCHGDLSPEKKLARIQSHPQSIMIGDGANDAPALKAAAVGIAVYGSLDASLKSADVAFLAPGLSPLLTLQQLAKETRTVMTRNLSLSLVYNLVFGALSIFGWMSPVLAAVLMPLSSLSVILSSVLRPGLNRS